MLTIRQSQIDAIIADRASNMADTITSYLRSEHPARTEALDDESLRALVEGALERGRGHGLQAEWDLCRFAELELRHGPEFDTRHSWAADLLAMPDQSAGARIDSLESYDNNYLSGAE